MEVEVKVCSSGRRPSRLWMEYTRFLRGVSADAKVSMRTLDSALWQYSKVKG
jgi:hypothetical protein